MHSEKKKNRFEIDMCNGSIMNKLISFSIPLMISGILQLAFNAVDIVVVGRFSGSESLAAVGSTTALINVFTNLFMNHSMSIPFADFIIAAYNGLHFAPKASPVSKRIMF